MLNALKRLFQREVPVTAAEWPGIERWALQRGYSYRRPRDAQGFVVEGRFAERQWRLEWGASQREYFEGRELRLRMELELPAEMQLLILPRELTRLLESETFERYTDNMKTQIDASTPEEMRWLVMYPKLSLRALPELHSRFVAVGSSLPSISRWLEGKLADQLVASSQDLLAEQRLFVLMSSRNRIILRVGIDEPTLDRLEQALLLFETAVDSAPNAVAGLAESESAWPPSAASSLHSDLPEVPR